MDLVRLACVRHAASVRPEPGSNSPSRSRARHRGGGPFDRLEEPAIPGPGEGSRSLPTGTRTANVEVVRIKCIHSLNGHIDAPKGAGAVARTRFFVLSSVFKERRPPEAVRCWQSDPVGLGGARWPFRWRSGYAGAPVGRRANLWATPGDVNSDRHRGRPSPACPSARGPS